MVAKEAAELDQENAALDFNTMKAAIKRHFRRIWREAVLARVGTYSKENVREQQHKYLTSREDRR